MRAGPQFLLGALVLLGISGGLPGRADETLGGQLLARPCPGRLCCGSRASPTCCAFRQKHPDRDRCSAMGPPKTRPRGGRVEAATQSPPRALPVSNASWFFIAVVLTCLLGVCICFSCEKHRRWLLGTDEQTDEWQRETQSGMSSSIELPADLGADSSACYAVGLQSANSCLWWTCVNNRNPETEMTASPQVPTDPAPISEADSVV